MHLRLLLRLAHSVNYYDGIAESTRVDRILAFVLVLDQLFWSEHLHD